MPYWSNFLAVARVLLATFNAVFATKPSPGCGNPPKLVTTNSAKTPLTMTANSKTRQYYVKLPDNYDKNHPYRLIYTLHALGGNAGQVVAGTGGYLPWYGIVRTPRPLQLFVSHS